MNHRYSIVEAESILGVLRRAFALREKARAVERERRSSEAKADDAALKAYLQALPAGERLEDGEMGIVAYLKGGGETQGRWDWEQMSDADIALAARAGMFAPVSRTDADAIGKAHPRAQDLRKRYQMPGGDREPSLIVEGLK